MTGLLICLEIQLSYILEWQPIINKLSHLSVDILSGHANKIYQEPNRPYGTHSIIEKFEFKLTVTGICIGEVYFDLLMVMNMEWKFLQFECTTIIWIIWSRINNFFLSLMTHVDISVRINWLSGIILHQGL
jgi:hypothetical protein